MAQTATVNRRKARRFRLSAKSRARIELEYPQPAGQTWTLPLRDISNAGLSFSIPELPFEFEVGDTMSSVRLHVGRCEMRGDMLVMHITPESGVCGALFYPDTDTDIIKLRSLISGIEAVQIS